MLINKDVSVGTNSVYGINALYADSEGSKELLALTFFDRSKVLSKSVVGFISEGYEVNLGNRRLNTKGNKFYAAYKRVSMGRDRFILTTVLNKNIGKRYLLTTAKTKDEDIFNYLMVNYRLPLLKEWTPILFQKILEDKNVNVMHNKCWQLNALGADSVNLPGLRIHGSNVPVNEVEIIDFVHLSEQILAESVSYLLRQRRIKIADEMSEPLVFDDFDSYIKNYGSSIVKNLENSFEPLSPLKGSLDGFAAKTKRLYPQQAACVNGIIALKKANSQYGLMIEGMGCGKTLQGAAVVDAYFNQKWLDEHKSKNLRDLYMSEEQPKYRNVLMAPSHLIEKWKDEITSEIPGTEVHVIRDINTLLTLRSKGRKRTGREWYLISKDFAKLGSAISPIPTTVAKMIPKAAVCRDCYEDGENAAIIYKDAKSKSCKRCGGRHFKFIDLVEYGKVTGLVCPRCGNPLIKPGVVNQSKDDESRIVLTPADFAVHSSVNDTCSLCGEHLWGVDCKPVGTSNEEAENKRKWYKISHYKNFQKKGRKTAFVLKGHENDYLTKEIREEFDVRKSSVEYGPRRINPSMFIKKYLKGYFDFCVLDEAHKYESGGSAQGVAAHALMKVSDFTLCLTGTITNGKADSLFYLLYMLDPRRMRKHGYEYKDVISFSRTYGCIETIYDASIADAEYKSMSRGRLRQSPKVKPGISPLLFTDFLFDKAVMLDLSDLSKYLPSLKENVVLVDCPTEVKRSYDSVVTCLKSAAKDKGGRAVLSSMLQFALAYPDKPYGFNPIMHPKFKNAVITNVPSHNNYMEDELLPKEKKLVEIVNDEIGQDRNCFIYCAYTGSEEMNITENLQKIIEDRCNLKGQVLVMRAEYPQATEREAFIRKKASEGIRVFICNMKLVETGLDFCFKYQGAEYNYPSIIFYQLTYELAVMWQASRRHYRLNQRQECHTYYMATSGTGQQAALQIMAEKQVAASAIQGKFSADGLASMAQGVDPRLKLAQMLSNEDDGMDRESLCNMFDVMNQSNSEDSNESRYSDYTPPQTFYELMDGARASFETEKPVVVTKITTVVNTEDSKITQINTDESCKKNKKSKIDDIQATQYSIFDEAFSFSFSSVNSELLEEQLKTTPIRKKAKKTLTGQYSIFDLFVA